MTLRLCISNTAQLLFGTAFIVILSGCEGQEEPGGGSAAASAATAVPVIDEVLAQLALVEEKSVGLAEAFSPEDYAWRPGEGVRSAGEVFMHMTAMNYAFPMFAGHPAPTHTGLTVENAPAAAPVFESSLQTKADISPELASSFEHLRRAIAATGPTSLEDPVTLFGNTTTQRSFWIDHVGHLREHLGQLIAYGRTNGVTPPWS